MRTSRFLCLAVSRRDGGNCVAGVDLDTGHWIRPVNTRFPGAFSDHELIVFDMATQKRRFLKPLDTLNLRLGKYVGSNSQPENWEMEIAPYENPYSVVRQCSGAGEHAGLNTYLDRSDSLLHTYGNHVDEEDVRSRPLTHSLALIKPERLYWRVSEHPRNPNQLQVRAEFGFQEQAYNLALTDPIWEASCRRHGKGRHPHSSITADASAVVFLTISLAAVPLHGYHYKLVAAVICASQTA